MLIYHIIFGMLYFWKDVKGGWVEIPEFSDETKVYSYFHKKQNGMIYEEQEIQIPSIQNTDLNVTRLTVTESYSEINQYFTNVSAKPIDEIHCEIKNNSYDMDKLLIESDRINLKEFTISDTVIHDTEEAIFRQKLQQSNKNVNETLKEDKNTFLMYLPTELFKTVHQSLKSQPLCTKGKLQFLKSFEKILLHEIESRLIKCINPNRIKRGTGEHYEHGYDDYEDHGLGFPSIEGALMAISFLTFAVYLVRLVMLLFRNNGTQVTTPTVFVGKKKRSVEEFNEETARIFHSVDNFISNI
ncbi:uncharacterized protein LOC122520918 [Polistes fuscatus]|uniref:uncharacterized protein LOC122520918 n=1 Tax=Polistes fuscatus TaxID=30207 RepID=UPI001CA9C8B2|nr:uncharacterized protein LOC122520918 [Polistes fuscatus]